MKTDVKELAKLITNATDSLGKKPFKARTWHGKIQVKLPNGATRIFVPDEAKAWLLDRLDSLAIGYSYIDPRGKAGFHRIRTKQDLFAIVGAIAPAPIEVGTDIWWREFDREFKALVGETTSGKSLGAEIAAL